MGTSCEKNKCIQNLYHNRESLYQCIKNLDVLMNSFVYNYVH